jgi:hypothetical protein
MDRSDIQKIQDAKNKKRLLLYKKLSSKCFKKIETAVLRDKSFYMYQVEAFQIGYPLYNITQYVTYLIKILKHKGFFVKFLQPNIVFISWGFGDF